MPEIGLMIEGGKATAGPPLGPALGPLGVNAGQVVAQINEATKDFEGITVPVKVIVDAKKKVTIEVGRPPTSQLILKETGIEKGAGTPEKVGDLTVEQAVKIAKNKMDQMMVHDLKKAVVQVMGTCKSMGITVSGLDPSEAIRKILSGEFKVE